MHLKSNEKIIFDIGSEEKTMIGSVDVLTFRRIFLVITHAWVKQEINTKQRR